MRAFHLMMVDPESSITRRIDFRAESPDHAFQVARTEADGIHVELWEGRALLARMTKTSADVWKLLPSLAQPAPDAAVPFDHIPVRSDSMRLQP